MTTNTMIGKRFGKLTVKSSCPSNKGRRKWLCVCDCGGTATVPTTHLNTGNTKSCGCLSREVAGARFRTHGGKRCPEYQVWCGMISRCHNPKCSQYTNYGGRGIGVCDRWRNDFAAFLADVGQRPTPKHSLDRIDNTKGYEPGNVRWATRVQQNRNTRSNRVVEWKGERRPLAEWAELLGVNYFTLHARLKRGWPVERVMTEPA